MSDYNTAPEGLIEIPLDEWQNGFFTYCLAEATGRQVTSPERYDLRMFDLKYNWQGKEMGYAIKRRHIEVYLPPVNGKFIGYNPVITFCRYGTDEDWVKFERHFAAQFAGDNS